MSEFWGVEVEEISSEQFPFENFYNMTADNGLILLRPDQTREYS